MRQQRPVLRLSNGAIGMRRAGSSVPGSLSTHLSLQVPLIPPFLCSHPPCMLNCTCAPQKETKIRFFFFLFWAGHDERGRVEMGISDKEGEKSMRKEKKGREQREQFGSDGTDVVRATLEDQGKERAASGWSPVR